MDAQDHQPAPDNIVRLFNAAAMGEASAVEELLASDPALVQATRSGEWGARTALHVAAAQGKAAVAGVLLRYGADVSARDAGDNATPLHWAAGEGHLEVARLLVEHGADVNACDDMHERGPLGWAVCLGGEHPEMAEFLLGAGAQPDIFAAIALNRTDLVRTQESGDPSVLSAQMSLCEEFRQPVHFAVIKDRPEMLELLIELGADLSAATPSGRTPLCIAVEAGKSGLVERILAQGVEVDLLSAIAMGNDERTCELLDHAISPALRDQALLAAADRGQAAVVERLLADGARVDAIGVCDWMRGVTPLIAAAYRKHTAICGLLLERGASATHQDEYPGATPLHYAAWNGDQQLGALLLDRGADLHQKDRLYAADAIGWAIENRQSAMVEFLLDWGATLDISRAAYLGSTQLITRMLDADPSLLNFCGSYGTALHQASLHGFREIVEQLLARGADTTLPNRYGDTVLTLVRKARQGLARPANLPEHAAIEELLLQHGALA